MNNVEWIVFVTRYYHWLVRPFVALSDKYLNVPLTFFSDRKIDGLDPKHKVMEVFPLDCPIYKVPSCHYVRNGLNQINKPLISIMMIDILPQNAMDHEKLSILTKFMLSNPVARGNLWSDVESQVKNCAIENPALVVSQNDNFNIIKVPTNNPHIGQIGATSLMPAVWRKDFLLEFMEDNWSFDKIELPGQHKFIKQNKWYSVGTVPSLEQIAHLMFTADQNFVNVDSLKEEDRHLVAPHIPSRFRTK